MNRTLVEHWQKHGLVIIDDQNSDWDWSNKGNAVHSKVREQLERFESGSAVSRALYHLVREAGFSPHTCMLLIDKKADSRIFTLEDFQRMTEPELFGFYAMCELDNTELSMPEDYREIYHNFSVMHHQDGLKGIRKYLAAQEINKP